MKWNPLETVLKGEDTEYLYFEAKTPGFSPFAITGTNTLASSFHGEKDMVVSTDVNKEDDQTPSENKSVMPGFSMFIGVSVLLITEQLLQKRD